MSEEDMNRPHIEYRSLEQAQSRAVVIDAALAKALAWLAGGTMASCVGIGLWIGFTVQGLDGRIKAIEDGASSFDTRLATIQMADKEQDRRLTALEIAITGIGSLRDQMDRGFSEISRRLERMEIGK